MAEFEEVIIPTYTEDKITIGGVEKTWEELYQSYISDGKFDNFPCFRTWEDCVSFCNEIGIIHIISSDKI